MKEFDRLALERSAWNIRKRIVKTIASNGEGHAGGSLSSADIMAVLYMAVMNREEAKADLQDKFLLSGGHKCLALYSTLCEAGIIGEDLFCTYNCLNTPLPGHPDASKLPGITFSTGSLGHGLSLGAGYALSAKLKKAPFKTYVVMGDGEQGEGSNWEAAGVAAHKKLDNLIAVIDENRLQINGRPAEVSKPTDFEDRYAAFGWDVQSIDGHDVGAIYEAFKKAQSENGKPHMIVAKTIKGKGLKFMEDNIKFHHWNPKAEDGKKAVEEIEEYGKRFEI